MREDLSRTRHKKLPATKIAATENIFFLYLLKLRNSIKWGNKTVLHKLFRERESVCEK